MKKLGIITLAITCLIGATMAVAARADEVVAPVVARQIAWGQAKNDLQLGVRSDDKFRDHRIGETTQFALVVRNVGKETVSFTSISPLFSDPFGTDEKGDDLTGLLKAPPPPLNYTFGEITWTLAPGAQREIDQTVLLIGAPANQPRYWAFDGAPGHYRVGFSANFVRSQNAERVPLNLKSGLLPLEVTADSPPRSRFYLYENTYTWGREVNGLQLGIRLEVPGQVIPATGPVPLGTLVKFGLAVRNVSATPLKIDYFKERWSISPRITLEGGEQLPMNARINLFGAAQSGPVFPVSQILAPAEGVDFGRAWLSIGAPTGKEYRDPILSVEPGKYRVRYSYDFTPDYHRKSAVKDPKSGDMMVPAKDEQDITSSEIILEVAPAKTSKL